MRNIFNFRAFFNYLKRNKIYTLINVFGLAVSLTFAILIGVYVNRELSIDGFHKNGDRIYVLGRDNTLDYAYLIAYPLQTRYPEIEKVCPVIPFYKDNPSFVGDKKFNTKLLFVDSTFFDFFDFKLYGDKANVLVLPNSAVVSRSFAMKAFGAEDPVGQFIRLTNDLSVTVTGVVEDIANSTIPYGDILVRVSNIGHFNPTMDRGYANAGWAYIFIMEKKNANLQAKTEDMTAFFKEIFWIFQRDIAKNVNLTPLKKAYFSDIRGDNLLHGDKKFVNILLSVGLAILLFALINYINLTVAQTGFRAKEMAVRRLLGASRGELFARIIMESTFLCFISFVLAALFASVLTPYAGEALYMKKGTQILTLNAIWTPAGICLSLAMVVIMGVISGWLPATIISKVKPLDITKGGMKQKTKMVFSRYFIIFQHAITVLLLVSAITITSQTRHLINAPLGYNTDNILHIPNFNFDNSDQRNAFYDETKKLASVKRVAFASGTPFDRGNNNTFRHKNKNIAMQILIGDSTYVEMLGLKILRENHQEGGCYITQYAAKELEIEEDALTFVADDDYGGSFQFKVSGVLQDFRLGSILGDLRPTVFWLSNNLGREGAWSTLVEVQGDPLAAFRQVKQRYEQFTGMEFPGKFINEQIADSFAKQKQTSQIILVFTGIAILISVLGLLAMSIYFIRLRKKEIAVRKVYGASFGEVLIRLLRTFLIYVVVAFFVAVPFSWYLMRGWLDDYSYRINLSPWIFVAAGMFCFLVSLATVFWQSRIAANANPIDSIKEL
jgi:putative ABC transport system permease protein